MPFTGATFHRHNLGLSPAQSEHAARIANAIMARGVAEGIAIATANKDVRPHRDMGGMTPAAPSPTPGLQPSVSTQGPMQQGMIQRFAAMSPEQLQELIPRLGNTQQGQIAQRILQQKRIMPQQQAQQQATPAMPQFGVPASNQSQGMGAYASGGGMKPAEKDTVPILAAGGEFVIAPHHVARLGRGDVKEGHRLLDEWVVGARKQIVEKMKTLRPPVKS